MTDRVCPKTSEVCKHLAACNHVNHCNEPIPISEFMTQSPENKALMESFFADLKSGKICLS